MRNQNELATIISYTELEKAIQIAARRYFLARNPQHALGAEIKQARADMLYSPGLFHGAAGNVRALNILMQLQHELDGDKASINYKNQLFLLLFAIIDPNAYSFGRSTWLATILAGTLIHGSFSARSILLSSPVFSQTILQYTMNFAVISFTDVTGTTLHYDKLRAVHAILLCEYGKLNQAQKKEFDGKLAILKKKLAQPHKSDITEAALSFRM